MGLKKITSGVKKFGNHPARGLTSQREKYHNIQTTLIMYVMYGIISGLFFYYKCVIYNSFIPQKYLYTHLVALYNKIIFIKSQNIFNSLLNHTTVKKLKHISNTDNFFIYLIIYYILFNILVLTT